MHQERSATSAERDGSGEAEVEREASMFFALTLLLVVQSIAAVAWVGLAIRAQGRAAASSQAAESAPWLQGAATGNPETLAA
jgi:hypothetical protein